MYKTLQTSFRSAQKLNNIRHMTMLCHVPTKKEEQKPMNKRQIATSVNMGDIFTAANIGMGLGTTAAIIAGSWIAMNYTVAGTNQYLTKTGPMIDDIHVSKKTMRWPFQTLTKINLDPQIYSCLVDVMSSERVQFKLPVYFAVGPKNNEQDIQKYARYFGNIPRAELTRQLTDILSGYVRLCAGQLTIDELFNDKPKFRKEMIEYVDNELNKFGLEIHNANIEELKDTGDSKFFHYSAQRALEAKTNEARIAVAEKTKLGTVGEEQYNAETRQEVAKFKQIAQVTENERMREIVESNTVLAVAQADMNRRKLIAEAESVANSEKRKLELQQQVEEQRAKQQLEYLRAQDYTKSVVEAETKIKQTEGIASSIKIQAEANARAVEMKAEADANAIRLLAKAEAEKILMIKTAEADGLTKLVQSAGGVDNLVNYSAVNGGLFEKIAESQSKAVANMQPKINIWSGANDSKNQLTAVVMDAAKAAVPMVDIIKNMTNTNFFGDNDQSKKIKEKLIN